MCQSVAAAGYCPRGDVWRALGEYFSSVWPVALLGSRVEALPWVPGCCAWLWWLLFASEFGLLQASEQAGGLLDKEVHRTGAVPRGHAG